ncbi:MAG: STAS domain-containing protein [Spirochaetes bacterium]|nr:STAS domain-containing protein [Spirochaetota bacterium]
MNIQTEIQNNMLIFTLNGEVDMYQTAEIRNQLDELLSTNSGIEHILFDCTAVKYMDSSGVGLFVTVRNRMKKQGIRFSLCGLRDQVKKLFELSAISSLFTVFPKRSDVV